MIYEAASSFFLLFYQVLSVFEGKKSLQNSKEVKPQCTTKQPNTNGERYWWTRNRLHTLLAIQYTSVIYRQRKSRTDRQEQRTAHRYRKPCQE